MTVSRLLLAGVIALAATGARADATYHALADGSFSQDWSNTGLITTNDDWSGVPSIEGYRGDNLTATTGTDPRTILAFGSSPLNVWANISNASAHESGGVAEVDAGDDIAGNPTVAFQGSGTADAPFVLLRLNTSGCSNINVSYNLRDIDTLETTQAQQVVLQARIGETGDFANVDGTYVAVANTGSTIPGAATLPAPFGNQAQVQLRWLTTNAASIDALIGIDDIQVTGTCADIPPTVSSTTPANNASNVAPAANITIQFSEAVTTNPGWIAINCTASGDVAAVVSGTGALRTLDPVPVLAFGEVCTSTVVGANVIDQDGTPDAMAANFVFSFTVQADVPPSVASTVPANGVGGVAIGSNLIVNFSEPVTVSGSWYSISCANSGAHPAVASGGPQNYTLNPDTDFDYLELCTVALDAALIVDQDGTPDPMTSNYSWTFTSTTSPSNYYGGVDASSAAALRTTLHAIIDDHTRIAYTNGTPNTWAVLNLADQDPVDTSKILDVYKNASYTKITGGTGVYNREHTWPNSLGFGNNDAEFAGLPASAQNQPYTDTHMLYLSDTAYNSNRGNKYFGNCSASCAEDPTLLNHGQGGGSGVYPGNSNWYNSVLYEVWGKRKGDMARAMFYMDVRYEGGTHGITGATEPDLRLTDDAQQIVNTGGNAAVGYMGLLSVLLQWHIEDPVTPEEIVRNEVIQSFQGNRNPFIDHPEWVACIWQDVCAVGDGIYDNGFE